MELMVDKPLAVDMGSREYYYHRDGLGSVKTYYRDEWDNPIRIMDALGNKTAIEYNVKQKPIKITNPAGVVTISEGTTSMHLDNGGDTTSQLGPAEGNSPASRRYELTLALNNANLT